MASVRAKALTYHTLGLFPRFVVHLWREIGRERERHSTRPIYSTHLFEYFEYFTALHILHLLLNLSLSQSFLRVQARKEEWVG